MKLIELSGQTPVITTRTSTFILLHLADFVLTATIIGLGLGVEGNPALANLPIWGIGIVKLVGVPLVILGLRDKKGIMWLLNGWTGAVVLWNLLVLLIGLKV